MRDSDYARARMALDDPEPRDVVTQDDSELIPDCEWCGCAGYLCVCDWLADDDNYEEAA